MLIKIAVIDGTNFMLPDLSIPRLIEINDYLDKRFERINKEFPNEKITLVYQEGKIQVDASDMVQIRLNVLDNEETPNR